MTWDHSSALVYTRIICVQGTNRKVQTVKGGNHFLFSGLEYKGRRHHELAGRNEPTRLVNAVLFVKETGSAIYFVMWPKWTRDVEDHLNKICSSWYIMKWYQFVPVSFILALIYFVYLFTGLFNSFTFFVSTFRYEFRSLWSLFWSEKVIMAILCVYGILIWIHIHYK